MDRRTRARRITLGLAVALLLPAVSAVLPSEAPARREGTIDPRLLDLARADPSAIETAFLVLDREATLADAGALAALGLDPYRVFESFGIVAFTGPAVLLPTAAQIPGAVHVAADRELSYSLSSATVTTRAREAWDAKSTSTPVLVGGNVLNGAGVGVAIIDSGVDGTHPDLEPAMAGNKKYACLGHRVVVRGGDCHGISSTGLFGTGCTNRLWRDVPNSDEASGHGTHVAGIVAGRGIVSDGRIVGAAPGARLFGLGVGEAIAVGPALEALHWVKCFHATVTPAIRIVSNSWGSGGAFSPTDPINVAVNALVADGLVVVFAAGNGNAAGEGGTGADNRVSSEAKNPTPGVVSVANYDDAGTATRGGALDPSSSRGCICDANKANWPDVAAPGTFITSTVAKTGFLPFTLTGEAGYEPYYAGASGTSMAAPHVSGIIALLLQANPSLSPADIEDILEDTAVAFATPGGYGSVDGSNPTTGINYGSGHGLVDTMAALADLRVNVTGGTRLPQVSTSPHVYTPFVDGQFVAGVQWTVVAGVNVILSERFLVSGNPTAWPLASGQACRYVITPTVGPSVTKTCTLAAESGGGFRAEVTHAFPGPGTYVIEPQISYNATFHPIDAFKVRSA